MAELPENVLAHLHRAELGRSDHWRSRLDTTTNWALTTAAAVISVTFASPTSPHTIIIAGMFLILTFLIVEARRYRYYDLWIRRVRLLEDGFIAPTLRAEDVDRDALRDLADLITRPRLNISGADAFGLRLRRSYAPIFLVLFVTWAFKLFEHPTRAKHFSSVVERAHIGVLSGPVVCTFVVLGAVTMVALYVRSFLRPLPSGELRARKARRRPIADLFRRGHRV
jgi:uncharacterized membrane protein